MFRGQSTIALGDALANHSGGLSFGALGISTTVANYTFENVVLDADTLILFLNGHAIPGTDYFEPANAPRRLAPEAQLTPLGEDEEFIFGYNNAHQGYQHWLTQCLPAIDWSLHRTRTRDVRLMLPPLASWQEDLLTLLGHGRVSRFSPVAGKKYCVPSVEYSDFLNGSTSFNICLSAQDTFARISQAVPSHRTDRKVLYVDDENPYCGPIRNRGAVLELLQRWGVTIVDRERLTTADRVNLFRNADAIIGPLGPGLADVVFCRPGALLWEWMPRHHQNVLFNRLAQASQVDYWGDLFETVIQSGQPRLWDVDLGLVSQRLARLSARVTGRFSGTAIPVGGSIATAQSLRTRPIDELMLNFESLGDNCEFGLVQRQANIEPLGLLRFNGFHVPPEFRIERLVAGLDRHFHGLGESGTVTVFPDGIAGQRELIARDSIYEFWYHTGIAEHEVEPEVQSVREITRLRFLRRKLLEDLAAGDKTWVWKSASTTHRDQIQPLLNTLRRFGPNTLLWVVEANREHAAGSIDRLEPDLIKGHVERFAPYGNVTAIDFASWFEVCWKADEQRHPRPLST